VFNVVDPEKSGWGDRPCRRAAGCSAREIAFLRAPAVSKDLHIFLCMVIFRCGKLSQRRVVAMGPVISTARLFERFGLSRFFSRNRWAAINGFFEEGARQS
jgi:hypothetical protein